MEELSRDFKGIWIPREVWLDDRLNALDKVILCEINSLDNSERGCYASNAHLAKFCQCSEAKISKSISKLIQIGYLFVQRFDGRNRELRCILTNHADQNSNIYSADLYDCYRQGSKNYKADLYDLQQSNIDSNKDSNIDSNINNKQDKEYKQETKKQDTENANIENHTMENPECGKAHSVGSSETNALSTGKEKKASKDSFNEILLAYTTDNETLELLKEWLKVRKAKRAGMTDTAIKLNLDKLNGLAKESNMTVNAYLKEVICRGWAAFYAIRSYQNTSNTTNKSKPAYHDSDEINLDAYF